MGAEPARGNPVPVLATALLLLAGACTAGGVTTSGPGGAPGTSGSPPASTPARDDASPGDGDTGGSPSLNQVEQAVVDALADLSLAGERAELPGPQSASMWIPSDAEDPVQIAARRGDSTSDGTVVSERRVDGVAVRTVEYASGVRRERFTCGEVEYEVAGTPPPAYDDLDAFLAAFLDALDCR